MTERLPSDVAAVYAGFPPEMRARLMEGRALLFDLAGENGAGPLTETLKWDEPAYLTEGSRAGKTVRLGVAYGQAAAFFICHTGLVDDSRDAFPGEFAFLDNRGLILEDGYSHDALAICLRRALTYHRDKRRVRA